MTRTILVRRVTAGQTANASSADPRRPARSSLRSEGGNRVVRDEVALALAAHDAAEG